MPSDSPQSQINDQELQFKKRARRRLVGAVALVLMMVVLLPMVLDDRSANAPQQPVIISIPSQDETEFVPQHQPKTAESTREVSVAPKPGPIETPSPAGNETPVVTPETGSQEVKPQEQKKQSEVKNADTKKVDTLKRAAEKPKIPVATDKPAESRTQPDEAVVSNDSDKPYYLQIGVFSDAVNVKQLEQKLMELKLKPYTEKISTDKGDKTRLRVGPFERKEQADSAASKVKTIGLNGFVSNK